ncbi:MAG TPA: glycosyltransferase family 4 protein [Opitutaceae bacterium]|nr:glycosyltransferase family 4 protein [Opitutaceae bacterium]
MTRPAGWICAQLGSREHYAIPRVLHSDGRLEHLLTDFWATPRWMWSLAPGRRLAAVRERWHPALSDARVHGLGLTRLVFDASNRQRGWEKTIGRNDWFQRRHLAWLKANKETISAGPPGIFFAYSYAACELLRFFKGIGWRTVLGQIDPGPREEMIVAEEAARFPESRGGWTRAPGDYWSLWREELSLADKIVVNSEWSMECLRLDGVSREKMIVVPLAFESTRGDRANRESPSRFTTDRPLRVLFLGQVNLRKGAHHLLEAAGRLVDLPIEFNFVGPVEISRPGTVPRNVKWHGPVSREETARYYASTDVFALPTLSDGFALTQLEALSRGVPVMVTRNCGRVVEDGRNGWVLPSPSADDITGVLQRLAASPTEVAACAARAQVPDSFSLESLRGAMDQIERSFE